MDSEPGEGHGQISVLGVVRVNDELADFFMNRKIVILVCAVLGLLTVSLRWWAAKPAMGVATTLDTAALKKVFRQGHGDGAVKARDAMEALLKRWSPVGLTPAELMDVLGPPISERGNAVTYNFDNGAFGWIYQFEVEQGKVVRLTRPLSE